MTQPAVPIPPTYPITVRTKLAAPSGAICDIEFRCGSAENASEILDLFREQEWLPYAAGKES